jgi:hypothetical protein
MRIADTFFFASTIASALPPVSTSTRDFLVASTAR